MELANGASDNFPLVDRGHKNAIGLNSSLEVTHGRSKREEHAIRYEEGMESRYYIIVTVRSYKFIAKYN